MNCTTKKNSILHRSSRRLIRTALPIASIGVGSDKCATAQSSLSVIQPLSSVPNHPSLPHLSTHNAPIDNTVDTRNDSLSNSVGNNPLTGNSHFLKPRQPLNFGSFNVRTLMQVGQQACLALTMNSLKIDVCCLSETRIQDSSNVIQLTAPGISTRYILRTSGDEAARAVGQRGVGIVLTDKAEAALLDWIPVNSRLCAVRLQGSVGVRKDSCVKRNLFVISAYAPTDCSSDLQKDEFYDALATLVRSSKGSDIVVLAGDFNAQVGKLSVSEACLGGRCALPAERTDNGDRLLQFCADNRLFLSSTNFRHSSRRTATWRSNSTGTFSQIDHIAVSYRWRSSVQNCRSYWSTYVESDHALVLMRLSLQLHGHRRKPQTGLAVQRLCDPDVCTRYEQKLAHELGSTENSNVDEHWSHIKQAMHVAAGFACGPGSVVHQRHWISQESLSIMEQKRQLSNRKEMNKMRRKLQRQVTRSLKKDRENWWVNVAEEMEVAAASGNSQRLFKLIRDTSGRRTQVSEAICNRNGEPIHNKQQRLDRWAEYFKEQFSWPHASVITPVSTTVTPWVVSLEPPSEVEVESCIRLLRRGKAAGPDELPPVLFKLGGEALIKSLTALLRDIWKEERIPLIWSESLIVPIFKKGIRNDCSNYRGISLIPIVTKVLASILLHRLTPARERNVREQQAGFRPGRGCIDQIFTLRRLLEKRHTHRRPTIMLFLDLKGAFDSVDRTSLFSTLHRKGMPQKFVNLLRSLYSHTSGRVRVYGELSGRFETTSGVR
ncbi:unnamed protein product [Fasciola hepatica]|uniref:Reverse transcriptase domain-containing protein n=1 Tax=Fasciola hepatica TaxID=6192 RepID=A0ABC9HIC6_FASHE|nr:unnamed protein product [Fasciola hepatica]